MEIGKLFGLGGSISSLINSMKLSKFSKIPMKGTVRMGIALALLVAVMLAIFTLSSPAKAVSGGSGGRGGSQETYNPIRIYVDSDGTIRVPFNKSVVFFNPYFGTSWDDLEVKCGGRDARFMSFKISVVGENTKLVPASQQGAFEQGLYLFIPYGENIKNCYASIKGPKMSYSVEVKPGNFWVVYDVPGYTLMTNCENIMKFRVMTPLKLLPTSKDISSVGNEAILIIPFGRKSCSIAYVPEQSVVEFCSSLMQRNVCEEATYIKADEQASCMGEGGEVCIMPIDAEVDGEMTMWGCCK